MRDKWIFHKKSCEHCDCNLQHAYKFFANETLLVHRGSHHIHHPGPYSWMLCHCCNTITTNYIRTDESFKVEINQFADIGAPLGDFLHSDDWHVDSGPDHQVTVLASSNVELSLNLVPKVMILPQEQTSIAVTTFKTLCKFMTNNSV